MTDSLNYILQRIEYKYLWDNRSSLLSKDICCLQDEGLPCNCITGIIVNYSAFLSSICLKDEAYTSSIDMEGNNVCYIQCREGDNLLCPVIKNCDNKAAYAIGKQLCEKSIRPEAYIPFNSYAVLEKIKNDLEEFKTFHNILPLDMFLYLEFWIRLLGAMRVHPLEITSKVFLLMSIYFFPNRTLKLIWQSREKLEVDFLKDFMSGYLSFLDNLGECSKLGFEQRFAQAFKISTQIDISAFVEQLSTCPVDENNLFLEILMSAYNHNIDEISRSRGLLKKICIGYLKLENATPVFQKISKKSIVHIQPQ